MPPPAVSRLIAPGVVMVLSLALLLVNGRSLSTLDSLPYRYLPTALLFHHTFRLDAFPQLGGPGNYSVVRDAQGHLISKKPVLPVIMVIPPYLMYLAIHHQIPTADLDLTMLNKLGGCIGASFAAGALTLLLGGAGLRRRWIAPAAGLGLVALTPFWFTAMDCWPHPLLAFLNTVSLLILLRRSRRPSPWVLIGALQGLAIASRLGAVTVATVFAFAVPLTRSDPSEYPPENLISTPRPISPARRLLCFFAGLLPPLLLLAWYNAYYFGSPFSQGFGSQAASRIQNPIYGLAGFFFSPAKGIFIFSPVMILALWGFAGGRWRRLDLRVAGFAILLHLFFWASYADWFGGYCYGARYLADVMPFGMLIVALGLDHLLAESRRRMFVRTAVLLLMGVSFLFQLAGMLAWDGDYHRMYDTGFGPLAGKWPTWVWTSPPEPLWLLDRRVWYEPNFNLKD